MQTEAHAGDTGSLTKLWRYILIESVWSILGDRDSSTNEIRYGEVQQVTFMDKIYKKSHKTIVWPGAEANDSDPAMSTIRRTGKQKSLNASDPEVVAEFPELWGLAFWKVIHDFYRPLLGGIWVPQEIALSPKSSFVAGKRKQRDQCWRKLGGVGPNRPRMILGSTSQWLWSMLSIVR